MRQSFILTSILIIILFSTTLIKHLYFPVLQGQSAYYFLSVFWICGILIAILTTRMVYLRFFSLKKSRPAEITPSWANRRNTFRIIYPAFIRPVLVVEKIDHNRARQLEFPVMDLSQGGSCFLDDGSLGSLENFSGHIRFHNGERTQVAGKLVRKLGSQVCVQFQQPIDWSTLLEEQRRVLAHMKSA